MKEINNVFTNTLPASNGHLTYHLDRLLFYSTVYGVVGKSLKYPMLGLLDDLRTLSLQADRKVRSGSTDSSHHLTTQWLRLCKKIRLSVILERILDRIPDTGIRVYRLTNFDLCLDRQDTGVLLSGIIVGQLGNSSTTIVAGTGGRFLTTKELPKISTGLIEMSQAVLMHGGQLNHYVQDI